MGIDGVNFPDTSTAVRISIMANPNTAYTVTLITLPPLFILPSVKGPKHLCF